ncbi:hypothetical protein EBA05_05675 [Xanthomonas oryzae pv. oryzae]|nr:hypothetical protein C0L90_05650 [Xanthomonas oryzae pv. oryzae]QBN38563.1 hypothetical protein EBA04_05675 [Xanthomonas oryzae pv. oryzae]QBN42236.1 hypothetical protein EBA05_05675 [Xanthomonas oryzae pv. oryzae]QBN45883.1 hypothetical protein EBA06_05675 [Xanthomonas oryzae pv. oryzae]QBN56811.1 hypothetical protein EBA09_05685 [Xanthomonas oryzae pv. oryzae]
MAGDIEAGGRAGGGNRESGIGNRESGIKVAFQRSAGRAVADLACEVQSPSLKKATEAHKSAAAQGILSCLSGVDPTARTPDLPGRCNWPRDG